MYRGEQVHSEDGGTDETAARTRERLMCFSATADLVVGSIAVAAGVDAMAHVDRPAQRLVAALPLVLGAHQLVETLVWWGLAGDVGETTWRAAMWVYLAIAFGVVPVLVPLAVGALEPRMHGWRTTGFTAIGSAVSIILMWAVVHGPVSASIEERHIAYDVDLWNGDFIVALYVLVTCGSLLVSRRREVRWFGAVNVVTVGALVWLAQTALISLWCAWAALTSVAIAITLRRQATSPVSAAHLLS